MERLAAVLFDMDGVLIDSYRAHLESWTIVCREMGLEITESRFAETFGRTSREVIRGFWGADLSEDDVARIDRRKEAVYRELVSRDLPVMDGLLPLLDGLKRGGVPIAVASSGPPENVDLVVRALGPDRFGAIVSGVDVERGKPDPQVFLVAAARLGASPARCVVIEDAPPGLRAARMAGMRSIALLSTGRREEEVAVEGPDLIIESLRELTPERIESLLG